MTLAFSSACWPVASASLQAHADKTDGLVIAIDPGHGGSDPGALGVNGVREADANWRIAQACVNELRTYAGVTVILTQDNTVNYSRAERVDRAISQGADFIVSMHCNSVANAPSANGAEVWIPNSSAYKYNECHVPGAALGTKVLEKLSALGLNNRGLKTRSSETNTSYPDPGGLIDYLGINYYPRFSGVPGIIIEHAFVTNPDDAAKLASSEWCEKMGVADAQAVAEYYGLVKADKVVGDRGEAVSTKVIAGYNPAIMGASSVTASNMAAWYNSKHKAYPASVYSSYGAPSIDAFAQIVVEEAKAEGVRPEIVFAQAMKETGWLQFGGQVKNWQCNFCGLGALDGATSGSADFSVYGADGVRMGIRAQVQHLKAYASTDALVNACVDPRFNLVSRGAAPTVNDLAGRWASDPAYGEGLAKLVSDLLTYSSIPLAPEEIRGEVRFNLEDLASSGLSTSGTVAYVDGVATPIEVNGSYATVPLTQSGAQSITMYEMNTSNNSDPHAVYPVRMSTWLVSQSGDTYTVTRYYALDDLLVYAGSSIRISGTKGIRMITGMPEQIKDLLTGPGINGYTIVETGTLIAWSDKVENGSLTLETSGVSRGKAYVEGSKDPVFSTSGGIEYYTNVLVGFNSADQYKRDLSMRPYVILEDAAGEQFAVYGGTVQRSIGYIAEQNADSFQPGTAAYSYV
ncbi:MAG: N-acetylmuramoyl-L-alanine amidase, partial [Eggerthellaceae bacterium]|nr:N-acetylmuramoyl-L-alanine amidase [Eggerthellaceae bacterium]